MAKNKSKTFLTINDRSQAQINKIASRVFKEKKKNVQKVGRYVKSKIIEQMSVTNYSLEQLKELGYPYKAKQFPKRINTSVIPPLKAYNIHKRDSKLIAGVKYRTKERKQKSGGSFYIEVYHTMKPDYAKFVFNGTKYLIGRNPFNAVYKMPEVQKKIKEILEK